MLRRLVWGQITGVKEILISMLGKLGFFLQATGRSPKAPEPCRGKIDWCSGEIIPKANVENELALGRGLAAKTEQQMSMDECARTAAHTHALSAFALTQTWMAE